LRASSGNTASGGILWLMPAMRRKERNGPGIVTLAEEGGAPGDCGAAPSERAALAASEAQTGKATLNENASKMGR